MVINRIVIWTAVLAAIFFLMVAFVPVSSLIVILNGVLIGSLVAIATAFSPILWYAIRNETPYNRVRQMTLGFFLCWVAVALAVITSIYVRASDFAHTPSVISVAMRYTAIIAAWLQVTAPDFGLGIFHGRDRKVLWAGVIGGGLATFFVVWLQQTEALAETVFGVIL